MPQDPSTEFSYPSEHFYSHEMPRNAQQDQQIFYTTPITSGYGQQEQSNGSISSQSSSSSLWQAIQELPWQYMRVLTKPSEATFAQAMEKANWPIAWVQAAIAVAILIIAFVSPWHLLDIGHLQLKAFLSFLMPFITMIAIIAFIGSVIRYLLSRASGGQGKFLVHWYSDLLFTVPIATVFALLVTLGLVFGIFQPGGIIAIGLSIFLVYMAVLPIFSIIAVHRVSRRKAIAITLSALPLMAAVFFIIPLIMIMIINGL